MAPPSARPLLSLGGPRVGTLPCVPWYKQNKLCASGPGQDFTASEVRAGLDTVQVPSMPASTSAHSSQVAMSAVPA